MTYLIDCEFSVFSLNCTYEDKEMEKSETNLNNLQVEDDTEEVVSEESDQDVSDEDVDEPGVGSRFMTTVSAFQYKLQTEESMVE